jgi:hypothetical protein
MILHVSCLELQASLGLYIQVIINIHQASCCKRSAPQNLFSLQLSPIEQDKFQLLAIELRKVCSKRPHLPKDKLASSQHEAGKIQH